MSRVITREEVKKHSSNPSVWIIIHNEVFDVTGFLDEHPGGADSLMDFAGRDGTQGFEDVGHSDDAREMMKQFKIGKLPPGEHTASLLCSKKKKSSAKATRRNDCIVCQAASVPKDGRKEEKSWRTFDGSPDRPRSPKCAYRPPAAPRAQPHIQTVVVPRERRPRGPPCESNKLKWALLALGAAIIIGVILKKSMK